MGWVAKLSDDELLAVVLENVEKLYVFTDCDGQPEGELCTWYFKISVEDPLTTGGYLPVHCAFGRARLCQCEECKDFGVERYEYFAITQSLAWIKARYSNVQIELWVDSARFYSDYREYLSSYQGLYKCAFIRTLGNDLNRLVSTLDVTVKTNNLQQKEAA